LIVTNCTEEDNGKYRFEADGRKTEAILVVEGNSSLTDHVKYGGTLFDKSNFTLNVYCTLHFRSTKDESR